MSCVSLTTAQHRPATPSPAAGRARILATGRRIAQHSWHSRAVERVGSGNRSRLMPLRTVPRVAVPLSVLILAGGLVVACQPTVKVEAPQDPITINLNIKLDAEVRLKIEEQAKEDIQANPDIF